MLEKIPNPVRWVLSVIVFWVVYILGPVIVALFSRGFFYNIDIAVISLLMNTIVQPYSAVMACVCSVSVAPDKSVIPMIVNATILCVLIVLGFIVAITTLEWYQIVSYILTITALIATPVYIYRTF